MSSIKKKSIGDLHSAITKKSVLFAGLWLIISTMGYGQNHNLLGQYFQLMQAYAPGLTGANGYLDIRTGTRQQWTGNEGAPKTVFLGVDTDLAISKMNANKYNSVRVSDMSPYSKKNIKLGMGMYFINDVAGSIKQSQVMSSLAVHVLVAKEVYLSLGLSAGYAATDLDVSDLNVLFPDNDAVYMSYLQDGSKASFLEISGGLGIYSSRFYLTYSMMGLNKTLINGNELMAENADLITSNVLGGIRLSVNQYLELIPNVFIRYTPNTPFMVDAGVRTTLKDNVLLGLSYRNDNSFIGLFGLTFKEIYNFSYSYEFKSTNATLNNLSSHEVVLGVQLFNRARYRPNW